MKGISKKLRCHFGSLNALILILYTVFVVGAQAFGSGQLSMPMVAAVSLGALLISAVLGPIVLGLLSNINACPRNKKEPIWKRVLADGWFYLLPLAVFAVYFMGCFPGGYSVDSYDQYIQAVQNQYNDWHPVLHTLLAFEIPLTLSKGWIGSVVLVQSLCFCAVIGYTCQVIRKHFGFVPAVITMAWILLNPVVMLTAMHPWKDVGFAICALLMVAYALQTVVSKGRWLCRPVNMLCFVILAAVTSIIRHNGILFTVPVILGVALCISWKRAIAMVFCVILLFGTVKGPVYSILKVEDPDRRQVEMLGLPMAVIGAVATESPELLDEETRTFIYEVTPKEALEASYQFGSFNSYKFLPETDLEVIEQYGAAKVISMTLRCIKASPKTAFRSILTLTGRLFFLKDAYTGYVYPRVTTNSYGIEQNSNETLFDLYKTYADKVFQYVPAVFMYLGIMHLLLVIALLAKVKLKRRLDWSKVLIVLSVFCYNFGSGLLLSDWQDIFRFFFYTFPLVPVLLLIIFCNHKERSKPVLAWFKK
jgi:hypothetical protein